jgi:hypothetical protein
MRQLRRRGESDPSGANRRGSASVGQVNILQTLLVFVVIPLAIYVGIALLTVVRMHGKKRPRYRPGQPWDYPAQWWAGDYPVAAVDPDLVVAGTEGGARGTW